MEMKEPKKMSDEKDYLYYRKRISEISGVPHMAITTDEHIDKIQSRVNELEHDIDRHIKITSEQATEIIALQRKLEVARDALDEIAYAPHTITEADCAAVAKQALTATSTDASDKLTLKEFLSSNMMLGDEKAEEIITSTDTNTKESDG